MRFSSDRELKTRWQSRSHLKSFSCHAALRSRDVIFDRALHIFVLPKYPPMTINSTYILAPVLRTHKKLLFMLFQISVTCGTYSLDKNRESHKNFVSDKTYIYWLLIFICTCIL